MMCYFLPVIINNITNSFSKTILINFYKKGGMYMTDNNEQIIKGKKRSAHQIATNPDPMIPFKLSQGFKIDDMIIISGQAAINEHGEIVGENDFDLQAEQTFKNVQSVLEAGGSSLDNIIKVTIYLTD